jgi:hypothetical protein
VATNGSHAQSCTVAPKRNPLLLWTIIYSKISTPKIKRKQNKNKKAKHVAMFDAHIQLEKQKKKQKKYIYKTAM